jgi:hypothetical protein
VRDIAERDLRLLGFDLPPAGMYRFLQMLAHNHGQLWNASQLARSLQIGATTAGAEIDLLLHGGRLKIAAEMKMNATDPRPGRGFYEGCKDLPPNEKWVIYPGDETLSLPNSVLVLPLAKAVERYLAMA